jgi:hypothetical protein
MIQFILLLLPFLTIPLDTPTPLRYDCPRTVGEIRVDGALDEPSWQKAPLTELFVDIEGESRPRPRHQTRARMLWDDQYFYIGAEIVEPHLQATLTKRDSVIFQDNDFEVFIDPNGDRNEYYELEINALNTVWDLFLPKPYRDGGKAQDSWDIVGLKSAVRIDGTLNDPSDIDRGWQLEIAIPWRALAKYAHRPTPPREGDLWRVNFSRVEWQFEVVDGRYVKVPGKREDNWVWSPQGLIDMHLPERWGMVRFTKTGGGASR